MLKEMKVRVTGMRPLLMHNGQLADPTNEFTKRLKELTKKRTKTEADFEEIKIAEWMGGLYTDEKGSPCLTEDMVLGSVIGGARGFKLGKQVQAGVIGGAPTFSLEYDGPKDVVELARNKAFCDYRSVVVNRNRVMRARPKFQKWECSIALMYNDSMINESELFNSIERAGQVVGVGDFRPRFGSFSVKRI